MEHALRAMFAIFLSVRMDDHGTIIYFASTFFKPHSHSMQTLGGRDKTSGGVGETVIFDQARMNEHRGQSNELRLRLTRS